LNGATSRHAGNFTPREKAKAELLVPALSRILEEKMLLEQRKEQIELLKSLNVDLASRGAAISPVFLVKIGSDKPGNKP
jgi:hypothetical protein